jgi:hypothetical protein
MMGFLGIVNKGKGERENERGKNDNKTVYEWGV